MMRLLADFIIEKGITRSESFFFHFKTHQCAHFQNKQNEILI